MTLDRVLTILRIGRCSDVRRCEQACPTCDEVDAAVVFVEALATRDQRFADEQRVDRRRAHPLHDDLGALTRTLVELRRELARREKDVAVLAQQPRCKCGSAGDPPHRCPYAYEIHDDDNPEYCTCCASCRYECAMDV